MSGRSRRFMLREGNGPLDGHTYVTLYKPVRLPKLFTWVTSEVSWNWKGFQEVTKMQILIFL